MKRMVLLGLMLMTVCISFFGCGKSTLDYVCGNMSECTEVYFFGENEDFYCTISSGEREINYALNGTSEESTDFALLTLIFFKVRTNSIIKVDLKIDGEVQERELELNTQNDSYMLDLEKKLCGDEEIEVSFEEKSLILNCESNDFGFGYRQALEKASVELEDKIIKNKTYSHLNAECYLRILDKKANDFDELFWCFTVVNSLNENFSVILSTVDGSVLAKSN